MPQHIPTDHERGRKRSYTNADLVRRPMSVTREQPTRTSSPSMAALDDEPSYEEIMAGAKQSLARTQSLHNSWASAVPTDEELRLQEESRIWPILRDAAMEMTGGPTVARAVTEPSFKNIALAALALSPLKMLRHTGGAAKAASGLGKSQYISQRMRSVAPSEGGTVGAGRADVMPTRFSPLSSEEQMRQASAVTQRQMGRASTGTGKSANPPTVDRPPVGKRETIINESSTGASQLEQLERQLGREIQPPVSGRGTRSSMQAFEDPGEAAAREYAAANPAMPRATRSTPAPRRVPMGAMGDEYEEIRKTGGAFTQDRRGARHEEWPNELWDYILKGFGK